MFSPSSSSEGGDDEPWCSNSGALLISSRMISIGPKFGFVLRSDGDGGDRDDDDDDVPSSPMRTGEGGFEEGGGRTAVVVVVVEEGDDDECNIISPRNCTAIFHRPAFAMVDMTAL